MEDSNIRVLPKVCEKCKDLIFASDIEVSVKYDMKKSDFIYFCDKCKVK